jgi:hypothetical protein
MKKVLAGFISISFIASVAFASYVVPSGSITTVKLANGAVTQAKRSALNIVTSASCGNFTGAATTLTDITNLSVTITSTGRPVMICMVGDGAGQNQRWAAYQISSTPINVTVYGVLLKDGSIYNVSEQQVLVGTGNSQLGIYKADYPCHIDFTPSVGSHTYKMQYRVTTGVTAIINFYVLTAFEL